MTLRALALNAAYSERPHTWAKPREPMPCPNELGGRGHTLYSNSRILEHGLTRCEFRPSAHQGMCGAWVWVQLFPNGYRYAAVLTLAEVAYMEHRHMSVDEVHAFLGSTIPQEARS